MGAIIQAPITAVAKAFDGYPPTGGLSSPLMPGVGLFFDSALLEYGIYNPYLGGASKALTFNSAGNATLHSNGLVLLSSSSVFFGGSSCHISVNGAGMQLVGDTPGAMFVCQIPSSFAGAINGGNASAGVVGEYIESIVQLAAAVPLATGVTSNVTSYPLQPGDYDVSAVVLFHGDGATNINDIVSGVSVVNATIGGVGTYNSDYLMIVPTVGIDAAYDTPVVRVSVTVATPVYLIATAHFTLGACSAYGAMRIRRVR